MKKILSLFSKSGERKQVLASIQEEFGLPELSMLKFHRVRWLSRAAVLQRILDNYAALRTQWERDIKKLSSVPGHRDEVMTNLEEVLEMTDNHKFLGALSCSLDILHQQSCVNRVFQADSIRFRDVMEMIQVACREIEDTYLKLDTLPGGKCFNEVKTCLHQSCKSLDQTTQQSLHKILDNKDLLQEMVRQILTENNKSNQDLGGVGGAITRGDILDKLADRLGVDRDVVRRSSIVSGHINDYIQVPM
jgi:hypothetical protein